MGADDLWGRSIRSINYYVDVTPFGVAGVQVPKRLTLRPHWSTYEINESTWSGARCDLASLLADWLLTLAPHWRLSSHLLINTHLLYRYSIERGCGNAFGGVFLCLSVCLPVSVCLSVLVVL